MAERVGFEPTVAINHTAFRERHLQPLGHLSGRVEYRGDADAAPLTVAHQPCALAGLGGYQ